MSVVLTQNIAMAATVLGIAGVAAMVLCLRRLKRTPPLTEADRQADPAGTWTSFDGILIFARVSRRPVPAGRLPVALVTGW